jgi:hypothetical protein
MFARLSQLARHLSRPLPNYAHRSAAASSGVMTSDTGKNMIHTAACLIIGDEVLGGKVGSLVGMDRFMLIAFFNVDCRHEFRLHGEILFLLRHGNEAYRSDRRR